MIIIRLHNKVVDASYILYAEHDFAASTFASRVTTSTMSDVYSCICTAIGTAGVWGTLYAPPKIYIDLGLGCKPRLICVFSF